MVRTIPLAALSATLLWMACAPGDVPSVEAREVARPAPPASISLAAARRFVVAPSGNEVRYRVREQLVGFDFPNDAVGVSSSVSGAIEIGDDGTVQPQASRFTVDAASFTSDRDRRDNYLRRNSLAVEQFPVIALVPIAFRGLSSPLPASGSRTFELLADLTVRDVTRRTTWTVTASFDQGQVHGSASTAFTFDDIRMEKPRVRSVLSVADSIKLEYDFTLVPESSSAP